MADQNQPHLVVVFSGKRKSGKDYTAELLHKRLLRVYRITLASLYAVLGQDLCVLLRLSSPLKKQYALDHNLDWHELMAATEYKEKYRSDMIKWSENKRNADPEYFANIVISIGILQSTVQINELKRPVPPIWIVVDARRPTDLSFFRSRYNCVYVRVKCPDHVRVSRGWVYTKDVDDVDSECALDNVDADVYLINSDDDNEYKNQFQSLVSFILSHVDPGCRS